MARVTGYTMRKWECWLAIGVAMEIAHSDPLRHSRHAIAPVGEMGSTQQ